MIFYEIEQSFKSSKLKDLHRTIWEELSHNNRLNELSPESDVAITAGSRGIDNIVTILKETVNYLRDR